MLEQYRRILLDEVGWPEHVVDDYIRAMAEIPNDMTDIIPEIDDVVFSDPENKNQTTITSYAFCLPTEPDHCE